jgi:hypothetical protein
MLALDRPRSTWLRKLSLSPDRSAIVRSVQRRNCRSARSRSPTSTSAVTSGALDGILRRRLGGADRQDARALPVRPSETTGRNARVHSSRETVSDQTPSKEN